MKNILLLDDNKDILSAVASRLGRYLKGCNIITAADGREGQEILKSMPIDLLVTDLAMPVVNGYKMIEHVKKHYPSVPVCVMTANCSQQVINKMRSLGAERWIEKPFQFEKLAEMIAAELYLEI